MGSSEHPPQVTRSTRDAGERRPKSSTRAKPSPATSNVKQKGIVVRSFEWFLELPVVIVLTVMWVTGALLLGLCALVLYMAGSVLW